MRRQEEGEVPIKTVVKEKYGRQALRVLGSGSASCCGPSPCCGPGGKDPVSRDLYDAEVAATLPEEALLASLGCGNPTALAELRQGEVVLDLGSGGGIDVILAARRVGPMGRAYGVDLTDEMLELARRNAREAGVANVEFLQGDIEALPLPDESVDVILSNCVINLAADKRRVFQEAFRVLRPGGRLAVSDIVVRGELPAELRRNLELWAGCVAGALREEEFLALLEEAGFREASLEPTRIYTLEEARGFLEAAGLEVDGLAAGLAGRLMAAFVRAVKPDGAQQGDGGPRGGWG